MKGLTAALLIASVFGLQAEICDYPYRKLVTGCYRLDHYRSINWWQAAEICRQQGAALVVIDNELESQAIYNMTRNIHVEDFWLGGYDSGHEGTWFWEYNRQPMSYTSWTVGQPDNNGTENCLSIHRQNNYAGWMDDPCSKLASYICEKIPVSNCSSESTTDSPVTLTTKTTSSTPTIPRAELNTRNVCGCHTLVQPCLPRFVHLGSHCYLFSGNLKSNWSTAHFNCELLDASLAYPQSMGHLIYLQEYVANNFPDHNHWLNWNGLNCSRLQDRENEYSIDHSTCCKDKLSFICQTNVHHQYVDHSFLTTEVFNSSTSPTDRAQPVVTTEIAK